MTALTTTESGRLRELETVVERGQQTFVEVGRALAEIRDSRLYRQEHGTFEDYCRSRWGFTRRRADLLIEGAETALRLQNENNCSQTPKTESQARPLTKLKEPEQQREAWSKAQEIARDEGKPVAARHVEMAVDEVRTPRTSRTPPMTPTLGLMYARSAIAQLEKISATTRNGSRPWNWFTNGPQPQPGLRPRCVKDRNTSQRLSACRHGGVMPKA